MNEGKLFINGEWISSSETFISVNPNTGLPFGSVANANKTEVEAAVKAAKEALPIWKACSISQRAEVLQKVVDLLVEEYGEQGVITPLKKLISDEMGKRQPEADIEVIETSDMLAFYVNSAEKYLSPRTLSLNQTLWATKESSIVFEPIGVVAVIKAWNYPLEVPIWALAPALITGNTVVFKPSEYSSFVAIELVKLFEKAGLPKGVLNLVTGQSSTGILLSESKDIDVISFTGSLKVGQELAVKGATKNIKTILELSGNDAAIVEEDADLELTSNGLIWGAFCNSGQVCVGVKRAYINKNIFSKLSEIIVEKTNTLKPEVDYGPLVSEKQLLMVEEFIADAVEKGARVLTGGKRIEGLNGFYFLPTVITNLTENMKLLKEECFGILLPLLSANTTQEAIQKANNSDYGLGASVWTSNLNHGQEIAKQLEAGMVWINDVNVALPEAPWGGFKKSGNGIDLSEFSFYEYCKIKHINIENSNEQKRIWWYPY